MSKDITDILEGWEYKPKEISARKIIGKDGKEKIQLRLDLGLLQMEIDGRPDGKKPYGYESLLEYYKSLLKNHIKKYGTKTEKSTSNIEGKKCGYGMFGIYLLLTLWLKSVLAIQLKNRRHY